MRLWTLVIAMVAAALMVVDFFTSTLPALGECRDLRAEIEQSLDQDEARLRERGRPATPVVVRHLQQGLRLQEGLENEERQAFFARAEDVVDYLVPPAFRPIAGGVAEAREALSRILLTLQLELHEFPSLISADLGIRFPSATIPLTADPELVRDQSERVTATNWVLDCLRSVGRVDVRRMILRRDASQDLTIELRVAAGIGELVLFYERFLADSHRIAPRELQDAEFRRLEPDTWDPDLAKFSSPPVELHLHARLWRPGKSDAGARAEPQEGGE